MLLSLGLAASLVISYGLAVVVQVNWQTGKLAYPLAHSTLGGGRLPCSQRPSIVARCTALRPLFVSTLCGNVILSLLKFSLPGVLTPNPTQPNPCRLAMQVHPWYDAQYLIPMLGMLLGNACSGIAVGLSTVLDELSAGG